MVRNREIALPDDVHADKYIETHVLKLAEQNPYPLDPDNVGKNYVYQVGRDVGGRPVHVIYLTNPLLLQSTGIHDGLRDHANCSASVP